MRSEIASVVTHVSGYGNAVVDGREKNQWLKSITDHYCQGFSEQKHKRRQLWCVDDVNDAINNMHPTGGEVHKTLDVVFTKEDGLQFTSNKHVALWDLEESDGVYTITHGSVYKKICASANVLRITKNPTTVENYWRFAQEPIELVRVERFVVTAEGCHPRTVDVLYWQFASEDTRKRYEQLLQIDDTLAELRDIRQAVINRRGR